MKCVMRYPQVSLQSSFVTYLEEGSFKSVLAENVISQSPSLLGTPATTSAVQVEPLSCLPMGSGTSV